MSKLILFTAFDQDLEDGASYAMPCTLDDEIKFSNRLGEPIIVGRISNGRTLGYEALARLDHFSSDSAGNSYAHLDSIRPFVDTIEFSGPPPERPQMSELDDDLYDDIISIVLGAKHANEAFGAFATPLLDRLSAQVERVQKSYCSFSDVKTDNGVATFIRPPEHGGSLHVSNLLFLDGEPSELLKVFGWTIGRDYRIITDLYAVTPDFAATVNKTGKLALKSAAPLDEDALSWHRQQFIAKRLS